MVQTWGRGLSVFGGGNAAGALVFTVMDEAECLLLDGSQSAAVQSNPATSNQRGGMGGG